MFDIFHMHVSYLKTLMKTDISSHRILSFRTLNTHILLIKRDSEMSQSLTKILSRARVNIPNANFLNLIPSISILTGFKIMLKMHIIWHLTVSLHAQKLEISYF